MGSGPTAAEIARTVVESTTVATLTTYPVRSPRQPRPTVVHLAADADGSPVVGLTSTSPAVCDLAARRTVTVTVAATETGCTVAIQGAARLLLGRSREGLLHYQVDVSVVRLFDGSSTLIDRDAYHDALPDPFRAVAPGILAHLSTHHSDDLARCIRAHGVTSVRCAQAHSLDRYGLTLIGLGTDGVSRVRLPFPEPLSTLADLDPGLLSVFRCTCHRETSQG